MALRNCVLSKAGLTWGELVSESKGAQEAHRVLEVVCAMATFAVLSGTHLGSLTIITLDKILSPGAVVAARKVFRAAADIFHLSYIDEVFLVDGHLWAIKVELQAHEGYNGGASCSFRQPV